MGGSVIASVSEFELYGIVFLWYLVLGKYEEGFIVGEDESCSVSHNSVVS